MSSNAKKLTIKFLEYFFLLSDLTFQKVLLAKI